MKNSRSSLLRPLCSSVLVSLLFIGTVAAQSTNQQMVPQLESPNERNSSQFSTMVRKVRHELITLPYYNIFDWLEAEVKPEGTVILRGEVVRPTLKSDAEYRVKRVESVTNVINDIRVLPLSTMDDQLRLAIYRAMFNFNSPLTRYALGSVPAIRIIVKNGRATLKGVVPSAMDRQLAYMAVRGVPGLFDVKNELMAEYPTSN